MMADFVGSPTIAPSEVPPPAAAPPLTAMRQCRHGRLLYLTTDRFIGRSLEVYGEYGQGEADLFAQIVAAGDTVVEVGANIGAHTVHLAKLVGPRGAVHAFEPQRTIFQILCANVALNEAFHVRTYQAGAGRAAGTAVVPAIDYAAAGMNFGGVELRETGLGDRVAIVPLDSLALERVHLLKIDVEGMEIEVLEGARALIGRHRPRIYVENDRRRKSPALIALLEEMGYAMWWHIAFLYNPQNFAGHAQNVFGGVASINVLGLPREQANKVTGFRKVAGPTDWWEADAG